MVIMLVIVAVVMLLVFGAVCLAEFTATRRFNRIMKENEKVRAEFNKTKLI